MRNKDEVGRLKNDNLYLLESFAELNRCYQLKVRLLQAKVAEQQQKNKQLIFEQSRLEMDRGQQQRRQEQMSNALQNYKVICDKYIERQAQMERQLQQKQQQIVLMGEQNRRLKNENQELRVERGEKDNKMEEILRQYLEEIEKLKIEKERGALKDISNNQATLMMKH